LRVVITGADGFIGKNLKVRLREIGDTQVANITRDTSHDALASIVATADFVFHLAGVNRPKNDHEFLSGNVHFTERLCAALAGSGRKTPIAYASSTQAKLDNPYGRSKRAGEEILLRHGEETGSKVVVFRLPNVFGKWCRPNYNSAVATFCHQICRGLPVSIDNASAPLRLAYIDDVVDAFVGLLRAPGETSGYMEMQPVYDTTVGEVVDTLQSFASSRRTLTTARVGTGLTRALYATYVSYLPPEAFSYDVLRHADDRGVFVEMLKTPDCGQFSYFTAHPGVTRGEHYHHSKTEKFLVIHGTAHFGFRHLQSGEMHELVTRGSDARIVETAPGWVHNITNIGDDELIVMLWANEVFDRERPDTVGAKVSP
jgi:UDP-2-acetamido-2,6-beta-L-arabino-hexul-4-ose reductase